MIKFIYLKKILIKPYYFLLQFMLLICNKNYYKKKDNINMFMHKQLFDPVMFTRTDNLDLNGRFYGLNNLFLIIFFYI